MTGRLRRRRVLQSVGSLAVLSTAGCLGGETSTGTPGVDAPEAWVPDPENLVPALDHYQIFSSTPAAVREHADRLDTATWEQYRAEWLDWEVASPDPGDVERFTRGGDVDAGVGFGVVTHDLGADTLRENLQDIGFEADGSYEGFDRFVSADGRQARALAGRRLVVAQSVEDVDSVVETVVDTGLGTTDSYSERDALTNLTTALSTDGNFRFSTHDPITVGVSEEGVFTDSVARGYSLTLDGEFTARWGERFREDAEIPVDALEVYARNGDIFAGASDVEIRTGDNLGVVEWTVDPGVLSLNQLG